MIAKLEKGPNSVEEMTQDTDIIESRCTDQMCRIQYVATYNINLVLTFLVYYLESIYICKRFNFLCNIN